MRALSARSSLVAPWLVGILALPVDAVAETGAEERSGVFLSWVRARSAASCVDASAVQADVVRRLGWSPFTGTPSRAIEVLVLRDGKQWRAEIEVRANDGTSLGSRRVTSQAPSCDSLAAAAALAIALLIDPDALLEPDAPQPAPAPAETAPSPPVPVTPKPALAPDIVRETAPTRRHDGARGRLRVAVLGAFGALPEPALGGAIAGEVRLLPELSAAVAGAFLPEQRSSRGGADVGFGLTFIKAGPCLELVSNSRIGLGACLSLLAGAMHAVVFNPEPVDVGQRWWWAVSGGLRGDWRIARPFTIGADLDLMLPLSRRNNVVNADSGASAASVFEEPALGVLAWVGPGVEF